MIPRRRFDFGPGPQEYRHALVQAVRLQIEDARPAGAGRAACLFDGAGGARTVEQLFTEIDQISETADDDRTQEILGALYDYAEHIAPER